MRVLATTFALWASTAIAFPWVANIPGIDTSLVRKDARNYKYTKRQDATCPNNPDHAGAAPFNASFPYTGAVDGLPGPGTGGVQVPAPGDDAHAFTEPTDLDIRGPCPGMNSLANHNFLSHDGVTDLAELTNAQQNVFNLDYALATFIAVRGIALDGDIATTKLSIGCDATSRTSVDGGTTGNEPGLDAHNRFEADTSLTRDDYFFHGDPATFNGTLFAEMYSYAQTYGGGLFNRDAIAAYRSQRYQESLMTNPNFYFGPKALLLYGAASFVYEVMPVYGPEGDADISTISTFFGAVDNGDGTYSHVPERIPDNWFNRREQYTLVLIGQETLAQYTAYPKLIGGNAGVGNFLALNSVLGITNGSLPSNETQADILCLLYQLATENVPGTVADEPQIPLNVIDWILTQINPSFENFGCALALPTRKHKRWTVDY